MQSGGQSGASVGERRLGGWRVGAILLFVAVVPLAGPGSVTWRVVSDARLVAVSASNTKALADQAVDLTNLDGAVFDEMVRTAMANVAVSLDVQTSSAGVIDDLATSQSGSSTTDEVVRSAHVLELAIGARAAFSEELSVVWPTRASARAGDARLATASDAEYRVDSLSRDHRPAELTRT